MAKGDSERETTKKLKSACQKADQWARMHASVFDPVCAYTLREHPRGGPAIQYTPLSLLGHKVAATRTAERYLGY
jgi:hypothetical protein